MANMPNINTPISTTNGSHSESWSLGVFGHERPIVFCCHFCRLPLQVQICCECPSNVDRQALLRPTRLVTLAGSPLAALEALREEGEIRMRGGLLRRCIFRNHSLSVNCNEAISCANNVEHEMLSMDGNRFSSMGYWDTVICGWAIQRSLSQSRDVLDASQQCLRS